MITLQLPNTFFRIILFAKYQFHRSKCFFHFIAPTEFSVYGKFRRNGLPETPIAFTSKENVIFNFRLKLVIFPGKQTHAQSQQQKN